MTPLVDNAAFRKALDFLRVDEIRPEDELNLDVSDTRPLFAPAAARSTSTGATSARSPSTGAVQGAGQVWARPSIPGSKEVLNWGTG
jgi:multiple sugar transport system substrate-binding protein